MDAFGPAALTSSSGGDIGQEAERTPLLTVSHQDPRIKTPLGPDQIDGNHHLAPYISGKATSTQTLLNMLGDLLGTGLLSCPIAIAHLGWIVGPLLLAAACMMTMSTLKLMVRIIETDRRLRNFTDIMSLHTGNTTKRLINAFFMWEIGSWTVGLMVLFSETLNVLIPSHSSNEWKVVALIVCMPTTFIPLRYLSLTSGLGVLAISVLTGVLLYTGMTSDVSPGSIANPAPTDLLPSQGIPKAFVAFGLLLAAFGGHALIPNLVYDMAQPKLADQAVNVAYGICTVIYLMVGCCGYRMYGRDVSDAVSKDLVHHGQTAPLARQIAVWMVCLTPLTKIPLGIRPLSDTIISILHLHPSNISAADIESTQTARSSAERLKSLLRTLIRLLLLVILTSCSLFVSRFESIQGFQGCYFGAISLVTLPVLAAARVFGWRRSGRSGKWRMTWIFLAVASAVFAVVGAVCSSLVGDKKDGGPPV